MCIVSGRPARYVDPVTRRWARWRWLFCADRHAVLCGRAADGDQRVGDDLGHAARARPGDDARVVGVVRPLHGARSSDRQVCDFVISWIHFNGCSFKLLYAGILNTKRFSFQIFIHGTHHMGKMNDNGKKRMCRNIFSLQSSRSGSLPLLFSSALFLCSLPLLSSFDRLLSRFHMPS